MKLNHRKKLCFIFACCVFCFFMAQKVCAAPMQENAGMNKEKSIDRITVAVSIVPEVKFVREVAGDRAKIICVIPEGGSPATYSPSPKELMTLRQADVYFTVGVASESRNILGQLPKQLKIVPLHEKTAEIYPDLKIGESRDPHIWLSPKRAVVMVQTIADEFALLDPANKTEYQNNANRFIEEIRQADREARNILSESSVKILMVFHPAFGYFADEYGLTMYALEKHGKEAGAKHLQEMTDIAKKNKVQVIFYQKEIAGRQVEAFAREIGGKAVLLDPLAYNYAQNIIELAKALSQK